MLRLVSLIGEQPMPVLLPILHYRPEQSILLHTDKTKRVAENLNRALQECDVTLVEAPAFDIECLQSALLPHLDRDAVINVTGGTKVMVLPQRQRLHIRVPPFFTTGG